MVDAEKKLFVRLTWLTKIFVFGDVATLLVQATGSSMLASDDPEKVNVAGYIVIGGLFLQVAFFGMFVLTAATFHFRMAKAPTSLALDRPWNKHMLSLYIVSALILIRSVMRCIEFIQGYDGYIMTHEAFLYCFDAVPMFLAVVTMNVIHPGEVASFIRSMKATCNGKEYHRMMGGMEDDMV